MRIIMTVLPRRKDTPRGRIGEPSTFEHAMAASSQEPPGRIIRGVRPKACRLGRPSRRGPIYTGKCRRAASRGPAHSARHATCRQASPAATRPSSHRRGTGPCARVAVRQTKSPPPCAARRSANHRAFCTANSLRTQCATPRRMTSSRQLQTARYWHATCAHAPTAP